MKKPSEQPLVTILCIAFNQEKYIAQALDSFLMQRTDFPFEIIVHDDASTDGTGDIIRRYIKQHPDVFRPVFETENQYTRTGLKFLEDMYKDARGQYIAICEGDDYWTDPNKLQKQVDFLAAHPEAALVFHRVDVFTEGKPEDRLIFPDPQEAPDFSIKTLLGRNFIQTNSVMYRRQTYANLPLKVMPFDWYMHLYHAQFGQIGFIDEVMSAYRRHPGGMWWYTATNLDHIWKKHGLSHIGLYEAMMRLYGHNPEYRSIISRSIAEMMHNLASVDEKDDSDLLVRAIREFPESAGIYIQDLTHQLKLAKSAAKGSHEPAPLLGVKGSSRELLRALKRSLKSRLRP